MAGSSLLGLVFLLILISIGLIISIFSWINNIQVKRYYSKVSNYILGAQIVSPGVFSYGKASGFYKNRKVEWRIFLGERGQFAFEAKMQISAQAHFGGSGIGPTKNTFIRDNCVVYSKEQWFFLMEADIPGVLEELYLAATTYEQGFVVECFECSEKIGKDQDKCPKCGWTWKT
jgi:hypothetical protein